MKTRELIQNLSGDLVAVRPRSFAKRVAVSLALAGAYLAVLYSLFHSRPDLSLALHSTEFLAFQAILIGMCVMSLALFAKLEVPGSRITAGQVLALVFFAAAALLFLLFRVFNPTAVSAAIPAAVNALHCATTVALATAVLAAGLLFLARFQAPTRPLGLGFLAVLASVAVGSLAVDLSCPNSHPLHLLFFHLLAPCFAVLTVFLPFSRRFLRW